MKELSNGFESFVENEEIPIEFDGKDMIFTYQQFNYQELKNA